MIEVRPFEYGESHIDEIVAYGVNVTIQKMGDYEFLYSVDNKDFQLTTVEQKGKPITLVCTKLAEDPGHYVKPEEPKIIIDVNDSNGPHFIERLRVLNCNFHIEQMDNRDYWMMVGGSTYWMSASGDGPEFQFLACDDTV